MANFRPDKFFLFENSAVLSVAKIFLKIAMIKDLIRNIQSDKDDRRIYDNLYAR